MIPQSVEKSRRTWTNTQKWSWNLFCLAHRTVSLCHPSTWWSRQKETWEKRAKCRESRVLPWINQVVFRKLLPWIYKFCGTKCGSKCKSIATEAHGAPNLFDHTSNTVTMYSITCTSFEGHTSPTADVVANVHQQISNCTLFSMEDFFWTFWLYCTTMNENEQKRGILRPGVKQIAERTSCRFSTPRTDGISPKSVSSSIANWQPCGMFFLCPFHNAFMPLLSMPYDRRVVTYSTLCIRSAVDVSRRTSGCKAYWIGRWLVSECCKKNPLIK